MFDQQDKFAYFVINLDKDKLRWQRINQHLIDFGVDAKRISAVYAADLPVADISKHYSKELNNQQFFLPLKPAEIGCFMSHLKTLEDFLTSSDKPYAVILEDDVEFINPIAEYQSQWLAAVDTEKPVMLKLYTRRAVDGVATFTSDIHSSVRCRLVPLGTQAAVINRAAAKQLLISYKKFGMPVDVAYQHWWQHGVEVQVTVPNHINEISEEVGGSNISQKQPFPLNYKIKRELKRSYFRLVLSLKSRYNYWLKY